MPDDPLLQPQSIMKRPVDLSQPAAEKTPKPKDVSKPVQKGKTK